VGYETPSDRFAAKARRFAATLVRFFRLKPLDGYGLLRTIWAVALVVYGLQILGWLLAVPSYFSMMGGQFWGFWLWWELFGRLVFAPFGPLLWLMIIRLVLEACGRVLREFPAGGQDSSP
jgi:hypothetical protein